MNLISDGDILSETLIDLIQNHNHIAIAVAWATENTDVFTELVDINNINKIEQMVIGTSFYHTHPDVLDEFVDNDEVRFINQQQGVFHPKVYIFWSDDNSWDILVGSANLTSAAMEVNSEIMLHISNDDAGVAIKDSLLQLIDDYWNDNDAQTMTDALAAEYRLLWDVQPRIQRRIAGVQDDRPIDWINFYQNVIVERYYHERCRMLDFARIAFAANARYNLMNDGTRKAIAGLPNQVFLEQGIFGGMGGAGVFANRINVNDINISNALDAIPLAGVVTRQHYDNFIGHFVQAFTNGQTYVSPASRLLALKRPDYFICYNGANRRNLCEHLQIIQAGMNYNRYWTDVVSNIINSDFWNSPQPVDNMELNVWHARAAMLDAIFFQ
ncbi:MAG: phospholipase D family protein [Desulfuromonadaceae bacterium]